MDIHRGSGPSRSGPTSPGSGFSAMPKIFSFRGETTFQRTCD